jgi:hypothetical protein
MSLGNTVAGVISGIENEPPASGPATCSLYVLLGVRADMLPVLVLKLYVIKLHPRFVVLSIVSKLHDNVASCDVLASISDTNTSEVLPTIKYLCTLLMVNGIIYIFKCYGNVFITYWLGSNPKI